MKISIPLTTIGAYALSLLVLFPSVAAAVALETPPASALQSTSPVIITELQTASSTSGKSDEFIELYNASNAAVDITGWQLRYLNASNEAAAPTLIATVSPTAGASGVVMAPGAYYVVHTPTVLLGSAVQGQAYDAKLSNADKAVALFRPDTATCTYAVQDSVAWGVSTKAETSPLPVPTADKNAERYLQRYRDATGRYIDTNNTVYDMLLAAATVTSGVTPGAPNTAAKTVTGSPVIQSLLPDFGILPVAGCTIPVSNDPPEQPPVTTPATTDPPVEETDDPDDTSLPDDTEEETLPVQNAGLSAPQITEILPNPAAPLTDARDEFIELYNPNPVAFDMSSYILEIGATTKRRYVFPLGTTIPAGQFKAFFSAETGLALSNSGSQVSLLDPSGDTVATADAYGTAKDGQAWARLNGAWAWTATPTPNATNLLVATVPQRAAAASPSKPAKTPKAVTTPKPAKAAKPAAVKTAKAKPVKETTGATSAASLVADRPIHGAILALIGVFAVLYGTYEYRHDLANYIYRLRTNRATRREARGKS